MGRVEGSAGGANLTVGSPGRVLLRFTLPLLGSVIFQQLYNVADSFVAGQFIGEQALAAVGNAYEVTLIYLAFAFGCNVGCSVVVAQLFGGRRYGELRTAVSTTFLASGVLCLLLMGVGLGMIRPLLRLINTPDEVLADTARYLVIYTGGLLFLFFYNIATGIFTALGDSRTPFCFLAVSSVVNIFVDIWFVAGLGMGVAGTAWATFLCQGVSCVLALVALWRRLRRLPADGAAPLFSRSLLGKIARIAVPSILQQSFISVGNLVIQGVINGYGTSVMAGYTAAMKLNSFAITVFTAFGNGMSSFTAQNLGARQPARITRGFRAGLGLVLGVAAAFAAVYLLGGRALIGLFLTDGGSAALKTGQQFLRIVTPFYLAVCAKLMADGVLRGAGAMKQFVIATFLDLILRVALAFVFSTWFGEVGIWLAWPVGWVIGTAVSLRFYIRLRRREYLTRAAI